MTVIVFQGPTGIVKGLGCSTCKKLPRHCKFISHRHSTRHWNLGTTESYAIYSKPDFNLSEQPKYENVLDFDSKPDKVSSKTSLRGAFNTFYRFSRPHTIIGTALSIISVSLLAVETPLDLSLLFCKGILEIMAAALLMNIYVVGLNQLTDVDIDKVNKPYLPLAAGDYSMSTGMTIVISALIMSFGLGWMIGSRPLLWALGTSSILGTAYSINLPLLRWKRFAFLAAMCIVTVRAVVVQLAFYLHMRVHVFKRAAHFSKPLIFATAIMSAFSLVIALFKDVPDIEGDEIFGIRSFTSRLGPKQVFYFCVSTLQIAYGAAMLVGASSTIKWSKVVTVGSHAMLSLVLCNGAIRVDLSDKAAITSFYMLIWKLFYAEYFLIPLVR